MKANRAKCCLVWLAACGLFACSGPARVEDKGAAESAPRREPVVLVSSIPSEDLIPREVLFGNPDHLQARLSPDGKWLSFLAPRNGVLNVWVAPVAALDEAKPITDDRDRGIQMQMWAYTSEQVLFLQDQEGNENWHLYATDIATGEVRDLTPLDGVQARVEKLSQQEPETVLVGLNGRDPQLHDLYRVNILTGERVLEIENDGFLGYLADESFDVRLAIRQTGDGGMEWLQPGDDGWEVWSAISMEDALNTAPLGINAAGTELFLLDSRGRNTAALLSLDLETGESEVLAEDSEADVEGALLHPTQLTPLAWSSSYERKRWRALDPTVTADFERLQAVDGRLEVVSTDLANSLWVVAHVVDDGPLRYSLYDRGAGELRFLFTNQTAMEGLTMHKMESVVIPSRDGLSLVSYLTKPNGVGPWPMVLLVHGGPWGRDEWGYDALHQWLSNRGYAVLSVNFRASTGFGKAFLNAGNLEWAGKMQDDLLDGVDWAVAQGVAQPDKVCIMGASYGGYATLVGLAFTPDRFACGIDIVGPSNLVTLLESVPEHWKPMLEMLTSRVGDHRTPDGRALLESRSPLNKVDRIDKPLLIGQGANDPRVKQAEADQIVEALAAKAIPVTYVLYPDEGHGFARPENRLSFFAVAEAFLALHLGGGYEPIGDDFGGSSIEVPYGAQEIPGLADALAPQGQ